MWSMSTDLSVLNICEDSSSDNDKLIVMVSNQIYACLCREYKVIGVIEIESPTSSGNRDGSSTFVN